MLYAAAWRRLAHVTQVVSPAEGIVFHNRLTHTLEVAQIGRRIAEKLLSEEGEEEADRLGGINPDVVETAALVHDLGHPPYGHAVETELNRLVSRYVHDGYEGNAQSFRIVTNLATRRLAFGGLNLTRAALNAILKYPWARAEKNEYGEQRKGGAVDRHKKWGVYSIEETDYKFARGETLDTDEKNKSVEAEIMDWADDVAYAVHDVEDFYRAGRIPLERFMRDGPELDFFAEYAEAKLKETLELSQAEIKTILLDVTKGGQIGRPYVGSTEQRAALKASSGDLIGECVTMVSLAEGIDDKPRLRIPEDTKKKVEVLKQLTWCYVIDDRAVKTQQHGQRKVVRELFRIYFAATGSSKDAHRGILPEGSIEQLDQLKSAGNAPDKASRARVVSDIISSMTERQLLLTHRKLTGIELGSMTDLL